ncbi:hypothetical protein ANN_16644 [Periplaneta americana]|uniref:Uncharacterized protein n=1 Tax=Periplaneta americana TaxID=6978 RepID=A0ABQ8SSA9_PERAM|nr:hypothetical protein ANN_16644 [Periplaneta americana]
MGESVKCMISRRLRQQWRVSHVFLSCALGGETVQRYDSCGCVGRECIIDNFIKFCETTSALRVTSEVYIETLLHADEVWRGQGACCVQYLSSRPGRDSSPFHSYHTVIGQWQDGATVHTAHGSMNCLRKMFPARIISRFGDIAWSPRSPDLTAADYLLWSYLKNKVYHNKPCTIIQLKQNIRNEISAIKLLKGLAAKDIRKEMLLVVELCLSSQTVYSIVCRSSLKGEQVLNTLSVGQWRLSQRKLCQHEFPHCKTVRFHVILGLPIPLLPCGFQSNAFLADQLEVGEVYVPAIPTSYAEFQVQPVFV